MKFPTEDELLAPGGIRDDGALAALSGTAA
jgi:hypothetical protein